jgi:2-oxoisovalerate dehydrogenase E1 component alpha subunit
MLRFTSLRLKGIGEDLLEISIPSLSVAFVRDLYARLLLTRLVDECALRLQGEDASTVVFSCRGHEAAQVASAMCIEVGKDFTLPYNRDLGVILTIGMTPYEVLRTYILARQQEQAPIEQRKVEGKVLPSMMHWGYHKHNTVTGSVPVATQMLHAAGIAFSCKLRKVAVVTVAYCGDGATTEADFLAGILFAAQHQLPVIFICEQDESSASVQTLPLPANLIYHSIDGMDALTVYATMWAAMQHAREGKGPVLLEMKVSRPPTTREMPGKAWQDDPLLRCQHYLEAQGMWDNEWAVQLQTRLEAEVERAWQDALQSIV